MTIHWDEERKTFEQAVSETYMVPPTDLTLFMRNPLNAERYASRDLQCAWEGWKLKTYQREGVYG